MGIAKFAIDGMHCNGCVRSVSEVLSALPGVIPRSVEVGSAEVDYDPAVASSIGIAAALSKAGYPARSRIAPLPVSTLAKKAGSGGCGCCG